MSLVDKVSVNTHYTRSVNLERDASSRVIAKTYIPTATALRVLDRMADALQADEVPRAWSLVGPYGSGKSSFAVFLTHLLGKPGAVVTDAANRILMQSRDSIGLAAKFSSLTQAGEGYCAVLITGGSEPLARRLIRALAASAREIWRRRAGSVPPVVNRLAKLATEPGSPTTEDIFGCIEELQTAMAAIWYSGLLIVIDELGKFLEYEARHYGAKADFAVGIESHSGADSGDIYLLQRLAEHAVTPHGVKLAVIVMLHQSFEQYARGVGESLKNEWTKIQGRFESISFLESSEQTLRVVAAAIEHNFTPEETGRIKKEAEQLARHLADVKALPGVMDREGASSLFLACYPLHPVSALLLPLLCQKVAQNERTLFSYLGSREDFGFRDALERYQSVGEWIYPWEIYEYFIRNQPAVLSDHFTHRRWLEIVTAIERLGDAPDEEIRLLRTIGLFNIIGAQGNFKASRELLALSLPDQGTAGVAIDALIRKSLLHYRKFNSEYRVWQGSDFDLDAHVEKSIAELGAFDLAERLNARHGLLPVVARRHTIKTGALRYFVPVFADAAGYRKIDRKGRNARLILYLAENPEDEAIFPDSVTKYFSELDVVVLYRHGSRLRERLAESLALEAIGQSAQALHTDPVAKREFTDRYTAAIAREEEQIAYLIDAPGSGRWFHQGERLDIGNKRALQGALSFILDRVYWLSPRIANELINRDKPSSQANAARNKLVVAMLRHEDKKDLGFEKFPPEKAIYLATLKSPRLHVEEEGRWHFRGPASNHPEEDPYNFHGLWQRIDEFLNTTESAPQPLIALNRELLAPPYGVKEGVLPILFVAVILANRNELAIYQNNHYRPRLTEEMLDHFIRRPDEFRFQRLQIAGLNASLFQEYSKALFGNDQTRDLLSVVKPIANFILDLPNYTQKTSRGLTGHSRAIRDAFHLAKSPVSLLLEEVPRALGYDLKQNQHDDDAVAGLAQALTESLRELKYCFAQLKNEMRGLCAQALHIEKDITLAELRKLAYGRYKGLEKDTIDREGLRAFLLRLVQDTDEEEKWFEGVLSFLGQKPIERWTDTERAVAEYRLAEFSRRLNDLEKLRAHYQQAHGRFDADFDVYLIRSIKKGASEFDEMVAVDNKRRKAISGAKKKIQTLLDELGGQELGLAALAEVTDGFLTAYRENNKRQQKPSDFVEIADSALDG